MSSCISMPTSSDWDNPFLASGANQGFESYLISTRRKNPISKEFLRMRQEADLISKRYLTLYGRERFLCDPEVRKALLVEMESCQEPLLKKVDEHVRNLPPLAKPPKLPFPLELKRERSEEQALASHPSPLKRRRAGEAQLLNFEKNVFHCNGETIPPETLKSMKTEVFALLDTQKHIIAFSVELEPLRDFQIRCGREDCKIWNLT